MNVAKSLLKCRKFEVVQQQIAAPEGHNRTLEYVVHPGAVVVLPLLSTDELIMLRQVRPAVEQELWELPAGTLDVPGEAPMEAALRELEEEAGYQAGRIDPLCEFYSSPGVLNEQIRSFVAYDLIPTAQRLEPTERIVVETMTMATAREMIREGRIIDGKTIITLLRWDLDRRM